MAPLSTVLYVVYYVGLLLSIAHAFNICHTKNINARQSSSNLFASDIEFLDSTDGTSVRVYDEDDPTGGCGEGFYKVKGGDGDCCVFDYDAAAKKFGLICIDDTEQYWEQLEKQNVARKKFGLKPLTPEQYVTFQSQIHAMKEDQQAKLVEEQKRVAEATAAAAKKEQQQSSGLLTFMKGFMEDTCQSNFDCQSPEVCCDFGFKRTCCNSGKTNNNLQQEYALIPVPQNR